MLKKLDLAKKEKDQVKNAAQKLLISLKAGKLVLDWRKRQQTRASVLLTIQEILDKNLPSSYSPQLYQEKCDRVYEHIYENYYGDGKGIYFL